MSLTGAAGAGRRLAVGQQRTDHVVAAGVGAVLAAGVVAGLAVVSVHDAKYALVGALLLAAVGLTAANPLILPALALPATLLIFRVGGSSANLSVSDVLLFAGTLCAAGRLLLGRVRVVDDRDLRVLLGLVALYEAAALVAVVYHPYRADAVEWVHEAFLAGGSLLVGWAIGREGAGRVALVAFELGASALSLLALGYSAAHHFEAANLPFGYQKNFVGAIVAFAVLVAYANPPFLALGRGARRAILAATLLGLLASQSRESAVALGVVAVVVAWRDARRARRLTVLALVALPALAYVVFKLDEQARSSNRFNSLHQRITWYHDSLTLFHLSPWLGEGLRWWYTGRFAFAFQPPNAELEVLTSLGLIGAAAFVVLLVGALARLARVAPEYGTLAFCALLLRVIAGQFDIFWVTAIGAIPWLIAGVALGAARMSRSALARGVATAEGDSRGSRASAVA